MVIKVDDLTWSGNYVNTGQTYDTRPVGVLIFSQHFYYHDYRYVEDEI